MGLNRQEGGLVARIRAPWEMGNRRNSFNVGVRLEGWEEVSQGERSTKRGSGRVLKT